MEMMYPPAALAAGVADVASDPIPALVLAPVLILVLAPIPVLEASLAPVLVPFVGALLESLTIILGGTTKGTPLQKQGL